jgi:hypothetical protein
MPSISAVRSSVFSAFSRSGRFIRSTMMPLPRSISSTLIVVSVSRYSFLVTRPSGVRRQASGVKREMLCTLDR